MEVAIVPEDMDHMERENLEEAKLQSIIEASFTEVEDDVIEINPGIAPIRALPMSDVDDQLITAQYDTMDANKLRRFEQIYGALESISIEVMKEHLQQRKIMMLIEEPFKVT